MKKLLLLTSLVCIAGILVGCHDEEMYSRTYCSDTVSYQNDITSGYNRDYNRPHYHSSEQASTQHNGNRGGYSSTQTPVQPRHYASTVDNGRDSDGEFSENAAPESNYHSSVNSVN